VSVRIDSLKKNKTLNCLHAGRERKKFKGIAGRRIMLDLEKAIYSHESVTVGV
jgi:hypothetical protein